MSDSPIGKSHHVYANGPDHTCQLANPSAPTAKIDSTVVVSSSRQSNIHAAIHHGGNDGSLPMIQVAVSPDPYWQHNSVAQTPNRANSGIGTGFYGPYMPACTHLSSQNWIIPSCGLGEARGLCNPGKVISHAQEGFGTPNCNHMSWEGTSTPVQYSGMTSSQLKTVPLKSPEQVTHHNHNLSYPS